MKKARRQDTEDQLRVVCTNLESREYQIQNLCSLLKIPAEERLEQSIKRLLNIEERLRHARLSQVGFEGGEDIVTLDDMPIGCTISRHSRQFERWWPMVQAKLLGENGVKKNDAEGSRQGR